MRPRRKVVRHSVAKDAARMWCGVRKARDVRLGETAAERKRRKAYERFIRSTAKAVMGL